MNAELEFGSTGFMKMTTSSGHGSDPLPARTRLPSGPGSARASLTLAICAPKLAGIELARGLASHPSLLASAEPGSLARGRGRCSDARPDRGSRQRSGRDPVE